VDFLVEMDAMVDIYLELGIISKTQESLLDIYTMIQNIVHHMPLLLVIIIQQENMDPVEKFNQLQHVKSNVLLDMKNPIQMIKFMPNQFMEFLQIWKKSKQKS